MEHRRPSPTRVEQGSKPRMTTRQAVGLGCVIAVLGPILLLAWGLFSYFTAPQPAWTVAWSPDGKRLAIGFGGYGVSDIPGPPQDDTVRIWDIDRFGKPQEMLTRHTARVLGVAFSPDGKYLATGDEWGKALLWDTHDLKSRPTVMNDAVYPDTGSQQLAFSPDSHWLVGGGGSFHEVGVWDVTDPLTSSLGLIAPGAYIAQAGFLPGSKMLVAISDEGRVGLWDRTAPGAKPRLLPKGGGGKAGVQDTGAVQAVAVSKTGEQIAGAGEEGRVWLWDLRHADAPPVLLAGQLEERVRSLDFSPDGTRLVACARNESGRGKTLVWNLADQGHEPAAVSGSAADTTDLKFSPDGRWLAASGYDGSVRVWSADDLSANPRALDR